MDYKTDDAVTQTFFASVQNKLHFAIHGNTAAEVIMNRSDSKKERNWNLHLHFFDLTNGKTPIEIYRKK
jgi:hypothetical protein